ncbi:WhiB family transcriptional regulator [Streptomyces sp. NPDC017964]|uniref:WhiB family transcriptional regulator n=1 Tax=Streptomyces sp. NPDC017964 TaxID=3365022 RepID=UPI00379FB2B2
MSTAAPAQRRPACADEDAELFFPIGDTGPELLKAETAKAVCGRCPLTGSCLMAALERDEAGVWGGTDEDERRRMKRRAARDRARNNEKDRTAA